MPQAQTFADGLNFLERHAGQDNWLLQIETFDPHEPFFTLPEYKTLYAEKYAELRDGLWDWPGYQPVSESGDEVRQMRLHYAALVSMCDHYLGKLLDTMDRHHLWDDTMLVVCTDHGFLLGEHDCWAKCWMPFYEEIARTPFFVWDPRCRKAGERRHALVQPAIDLAPTLLAWHGLPPLPHATGKDLAATVAGDTPVRDTAIFGIHGGQVNITDGRHVYMRGPVSPDNQPLHEYTLMPAHMRERFAPAELQQHDLAPPFSFMQQVRPLRIPLDRTWKGASEHPDRSKTLLYDLQQDPMQQTPLQDSALEARFCSALSQHLHDCDAPDDQWLRLGIARYA